MAMPASSPRLNRPATGRSPRPSKRHPEPGKLLACGGWAISPAPPVVQKASLTSELNVLMERRTNQMDQLSHKVLRRNSLINDQRVSFGRQIKLLKGELHLMATGTARRPDLYEKVSHFDEESFLNDYKALLRAEMQEEMADAAKADLRAGGGKTSRRQMESQMR